MRYDKNLMGYLNYKNNPIIVRRFFDELSIPKYFYFRIFIFYMELTIGIIFCLSMIFSDI